MKESGKVIIEEKILAKHYFINEITPVESKLFNPVIYQFYLSDYYYHQLLTNLQ